MYGHSDQVRDRLKMQDTKNNILVVYKSTGVRHAIIDSLDDGHVVHEAFNGEEAWDLLEFTDTVSLVFVDMNLPTMDSLLLLRKIKATECQRIANLPVIIITEYDTKEDAKYVSDMIGATGFICKPFDSTAISNLANSYSRLHKNTPKNKQIDVHDKITGCLKEAGFTEYCSHILRYTSCSHEDTSLIFIQVMGVDDAFKKLDENIFGQIIMAVADYLNQACRKDEKVAYLGAGRFAIVLLTTNDFRARIASIRLQKKISSMKFRNDGTRILLKSAVGISSTNGSKNKPVFDELRMQAEQALQVSIEHPDSAIVRYNEEFYLNQMQLKGA